MAKALLTKKNSNVVLKDVFFGDSTDGIATQKTYIEGLNPSVTFTYEEFTNPEDVTFTSAVIDETEQATLNLDTI